MSNTIALRSTSHAAMRAGYEVRATKKREYISQFTVLLRDLYNNDPRMVGFRDDPKADEKRYSDPDNHVLLIFHDNRVIGGACLRISTPEYPVSLELEDDMLSQSGQPFFSLRNQFPTLDLEHYAYAECSYVAIHPDFRNGEVLRSLFTSIIDFYQKYHVRYMFAAGDLVRLRTYKRVLKCLNEEVNIMERLGYESENVRLNLLFGEFRSYREAQMQAKPSAVSA